MRPHTLNNYARNDIQHSHNNAQFCNVKPVFITAPSSLPIWACSDTAIFYRHYKIFVYYELDGILRISSAPVAIFIRYPTHGLAG